MGRQAKAKANKKGSRGRRSTPNHEAAAESAEPAPAAEIADVTETTSAANASVGTIGTTTTLDSEVAELQLSSPSESTDNGHTETAFAISELDNIDAAITGMMQPGRKIDFKRLSKYLPHTVQRLRTGSVGPPQLATVLINIALALQSVDHLVPLLSERVVPSRANKELNRDFTSSLKDNIRRAVQARFCKPLLRDWVVEMVNTVQKTFDETCLEWEERISAKLFRGSRLTFRRSCPLFHASVEVFEHFMGTNHQESEAARVRSLHHDIRLAASHVSECLDKVKRTCWECGQPSATSKECGKCKVAIYCGRDCQEKAWKDGHKNACCELKQENEAFEDSLAVVDAAYEAGAMMHEIKLSDCYDYTLVYGMIKHQIDKTDQVDRPSMTIFYENLGRVVRGEWWLYATTNSVSEYQLAMQQAGKTTDEERDYFGSVCAYLSYDYATHRAVPTLVSAVVQKSNEFCGNPMPASRFLEIYKQNNGLTNNRSKAARLAKVEALRKMRLRLHKA